MIKILKQTPITFKGRDRIELLVQDSLGCDDPCDHCCYDGYFPADPHDGTCDVFHGCGSRTDYFFIIA